LVYTHVLKVGGGAVRSPLDAMCAANPLSTSALLQCREAPARYGTMH
jgi:hypothetical protein